MGKVRKWEGGRTLLAQFGQDYCLPIFNAKLYDRSDEEGERVCRRCRRRLRPRIQLCRRGFNRQAETETRLDNGLPLLSLGIEETRREEREGEREEDTKPLLPPKKPRTQTHEQAKASFVPPAKFSN